MPRFRSGFQIIPCEEHHLAVGPFGLIAVPAGSEALQVDRVGQPVLNYVPSHGPARLLREEANDPRLAILDFLEDGRDHRHRGLPRQSIPG